MQQGHKRAKTTLLAAKQPQKKTKRKASTRNNIQPIEAHDFHNDFINPPVTIYNINKVDITTHINTNRHCIHSNCTPYYIRANTDGFTA